MNWIWEMLSTEMVHRLSWTLLHSLWQCTAIGIVIAAMLRGLQQRSSQLRYLVACGGLVGMLASGAATFVTLAVPAETAGRNYTSEAQEPMRAANDAVAVSFPARKVETNAATSASDRSNAVDVSRPEPGGGESSRVASAFMGWLTKIPVSWLPRISIAWIGGVLFFSIRNLNGWLGVQRLRRMGTKPTAGEYLECARALIARMKISRPVQIVESTLVQVPIVVGWLKPMILLPASLLGEMSPAQLDAILAHELAHVRRHDYVMNLLQTLLETLLFYHPAVWWVSRQVRIEREHCCDDMAVLACGSKIDLSEALTIVAASRLNLQPALAATGSSASGALQRVRRLLDPKADALGRSKLSSTIVVLVLLTSIVVASWKAFAAPPSSPENAAEQPHAAATNQEREEVDNRAKQDSPAETPLADAVYDFNQQSAKDETGKTQPPLTVDEVVAAIRSKTPADYGDLPADAVGLYQKIAAARKLPAGAKFDALTKIETGNTRLDVWNIGLIVRSKSGTVCKIGIRDQVLKSRAIPPLERWIVEGRDAVVLAAKCKPQWGDAQEGVQIGLARLDGGRTLMPNEHLPLEFFIRNSGDREVTVEFIHEFRTLPPTVRNQKQELVHVTASNIQTYRIPDRYTLEPGEIIAYKHPGLRFDKQSLPSLTSAKPGKYSIQDNLGVTLKSSNEVGDEKRLQLLTAPIDFEILTSIRGRVVDHQDNPVSKARVVFSPPKMLTVEDGRVNISNDDDERRIVVADADGRFMAHANLSEIEHIVVVAPQIRSFIFPVPRNSSPDDEVVIKLPQPATLKIVVDIPGALQGNEHRHDWNDNVGPRIVPSGDKIVFNLHLKTWQNPILKNAGSIRETQLTPNSSEVTFENLAPGVYDFTRTKMLARGEDAFGHAMLDRQDVTLHPGENKVVRLVRSRGQRVTGKVTGVKDDGPLTVIRVRSVEVSGDPHPVDVKEYFLPTYDALTCAPQETFHTSLLAPGKYKLVAETYFPEPLEERFMTGIRLPALVGTAEVTVQDDDPAKPALPVPDVVIEMKPREEKKKAAAQSADPKKDSPPAKQKPAEDAPKPLPKIEGRITDRDGKPVIDALVQWGYIHDPVEKLQQTTTDVDGKYQLEVRTWGVDYRLGVSAEGMAPQWLIPRSSWHGGLSSLPSDDAVPPPPKADFKFEPQHRLTGIVVDEKGRPIPAVSIVAETASTGFHSSFSSPSPATPIPGPGPRTTSTGPDGRFVLEQLPDEEVHLTLNTPHRHVNAQNYAVDKEARIVMSGSGRPGVIRIRVIDAETKDPVPQYELFRRYESERKAVNDPEGRYESKQSVTEGSTNWIYIYNKDSAPTEAEVKGLPLDSKEEVVIQLQRGQPVTSQLVDAKTGKPIAGAPILYGVTPEKTYIEWSDWKEYADGYHSFDTVQHTLTDEQGNFWFSEAPNLRNGTLFILIPGYERLILKPADRPAVDAQGRFQIKLVGEATISGTLLKDGKPQANVEVSVWKQEPRGNIDETFERTRTDADGKFRLTSLTPGTYGVWYQIQKSRSIFTNKSFATVKLAPGEQKTLEPFSIGDAKPKQE